MLGDDHPTVECTHDSIEVVETASRQSKKKSNFLFGTSDAVCNHENPSNIIEMLGLNSLEAMSPSEWFQYPCGQVSYIREDDGQSSSKKKQNQKSRKRRDNNIG